MSEFRILSLDGGGIKGVLAASVAAELEQQVQRPLWNYFDLITGTSTGGILALALGLGIPATDILELYRTKGTLIFTPRRPWLSRVPLINRFVKHAYSGGVLKDALGSVFEDRLLGDARTRLVIPSTSAMTGDVYIYKTRHHERLLVDYRAKAVDVAMATAAAPTYFPAYQGANRTWLLDGGMWANNPILVGVVEALTVLGCESKSVRVLSIGSTVEPKRLTERVRLRGGIIDWCFLASEWLLHGQSIAAMNQASLLIGTENVLRIEKSVPPGVYSLDGHQYVDELVGLGHELARHNMPRILKEFLRSSTAPFQAVASDSRKQ